MELANENLVLVRRVVEARRLEAQGTAQPQPYRTAALPAPRANETTHTRNEKSEDEPTQSFWRKLQCW
jgi:GTPase KRas protein